MFWMTHPQLTFGEVFPHAQVAKAIGVGESDIVGNVPAQIVSTGIPFLFVALRDAAAVDAAEIDAAAFRSVPGKNLLAVFLFAGVGGDRLYSPCLGLDIAEDPATGSASGAPRADPGQVRLPRPGPQGRTR